MTEQRTLMLRDGLIAGVIGYAVVATFFVVFNLAVGQPALYTAALLGESLFAGVRDPAALTLDPGLVLAFNGVQLVVMLLFGLFAAWLVYEAELHPEFWYLAFFLFLAALVAGYAGVLVITLLMGTLLSPWLVVTASLLGALSMALYLTLSHRRLVHTVMSARDAGSVVP